MKNKHEIIVGNIGLVYNGPNAIEAERVYNNYIEQSKSNMGRAGDELVSWFLNDEIHKEYYPDRSLALSFVVSIVVEDVDGDRLDQKIITEQVIAAMRTKLFAFDLDYENLVVKQLSVREAEE